LTLLDVKVESIQAEGTNTTPAYQLLRVVQQTVLQPYGFKGQEVHLLPLVPDIVTAMHPQQKLLVIDPPEGKYYCQQPVSHLTQQLCMDVRGRRIGC
jgi:hypothetical protein